MTWRSIGELMNLLINCNCLYSDKAIPHERRWTHVAGVHNWVVPPWPAPRSCCSHGGWPPAPTHRGIYRYIMVRLIPHLNHVCLGGAVYIFLCYCYTYQQGVAIEVRKEAWTPFSRDSYQRNSVVYIVYVVYVYIVLYFYDHSPFIHSLHF